MATIEELKEQQKKLWGGAATDWETWDEWFEAQCEPLTEWLCGKIDVGPGTRLLDLASGAGQPGLTAAQRIGPTGHVVSSDLAPEMVAAAQRLSKAKGLTNVEHREIDIEKIPYPDASFDAVTCRFGLMLCPDPAKAASEIRRVLKPGGRFAVAVWAGPAQNAQFSSFLGPLGEIAPPPPPNPGAPGLFRLAAPEEFESVLREGGLEDVTVEPVPSEWEFSSPQNYWDIMTVLAAPLKAAAATLPAETVTRLREAVVGNLRTRYGDGALKLPVTPLGASGQR